MNSPDRRKVDKNARAWAKNFWHFFAPAEIRHFSPFPRWAAKIRPQKQRRQTRRNPRILPISPYLPNKN